MRELISLETSAREVLVVVRHDERGDGLQRLEESRARRTDLRDRPAPGFKRLERVDQRLKRDRDRCRDRIS